MGTSTAPVRQMTWACMRLCDDYAVHHSTKNISLESIVTAQVFWNENEKQHTCIRGRFSPKIEEFCLVKNCDRANSPIKTITFPLLHIANESILQRAHLCLEPYNPFCILTFLKALTTKFQISHGSTKFVLKSSLTEPL